MPNWCECKLLIEGSAERVSELLRRADALNARGFDFNRFVPCPKEYRLPDAAGADRDQNLARTGERPADGPNLRGRPWCLAHWGTMANAQRVTVDGPLIVEGQTRAVVHFSTPATAPVPVVRKASEMFPDLRLELCYSDEAHEFRGRLVCTGGKALIDERVTRGRQFVRIDHGPQEFEWTLRDVSVLWQRVEADASVRPEDRRATFEAALGGNPGWYRAAVYDLESAARVQTTEESRGGPSLQTFPGREPGSLVRVGWDQGLESFFGQVWKERSLHSADHPLLTSWFGSRRLEVLSVSALQALMQSDADIPAAVTARLEAEPLRQEARPPKRDTRRNVTEQEPPPAPAHRPKMTHEF